MNRHRIPTLELYQGGKAEIPEATHYRANAPDDFLTALEKTLKLRVAAKKHPKANRNEG